ncbi:PLP-dependent aspartate aminotransferase family protein, partial [Aeromonas sp. CPF2-S1]|nr:PLP-dependent aspartate aminotransferase family protein [Aeromonas sp. CPF2-S1]
MKFKTMSVHSGQRIDPQTGALTTPLYQSSTFSYFNAQAGKERFAGQAPGFIYSRFGNPTTAELEQKLAALEGADEALVVASGMAAVSAIMYALADSGDEVAYIGPLYGGTDAFLKQTFSRAGIKITAYESDQALLANIRPATKVVLFETLTNPTLKVV